MLSRWQNLSRQHFYPRPPRGGRRCIGFAPVSSLVFLSTPSARRATGSVIQLQVQQPISIHALREEGDPQRQHRWHSEQISIHALREEGDVTAFGIAGLFLIFLSTPSARRATLVVQPFGQTLEDFYPRPPRGGRRRCAAACGDAGNFYPRPPRGGRRGACCGIILA